MLTALKLGNIFLTWFQGLTWTSGLWWRHQQLPGLIIVCKWQQRCHSQPLRWWIIIFISPDQMQLSWGGCSPALHTNLAPPSAGVAFNLLTVGILSLSKEQVWLGNAYLHTNTTPHTNTQRNNMQLKQRREQNNKNRLNFFSCLYSMYSCMTLNIADCMTIFLLF